MQDIMNYAKEKLFKNLSLSGREKLSNEVLEFLESSLSSSLASRKTGECFMLDSSVSEDSV